MYVKTSIPKSSTLAAPVIKKDDIIIIDVDDVTAEPTRAFGNTVATGNISVATGAEAIRMKVSNHTIECGYDQEGEVDAKGFKHKVSFEYPGNTPALDNFVEAYANKGVIILVQSCETGKTKLYGQKCNPLRLTAEPTDSKEANKTKLNFAQEIPSPYLPSVYSGTVPEVADDPSTSGSGSGESE